MIQMIETITVRTAPAPPGAGMRCESAGGGLERVRSGGRRLPTKQAAMVPAKQAAMVPRETGGSQ